MMRYGFDIQSAPIQPSLPACRGPRQRHRALPARHSLATKASQCIAANDHSTLGTAHCWSGIEQIESLRLHAEEGAGETGQVGVEAGPLQRRPGRFHPRLPQRGGAGIRFARFLTNNGLFPAWNGHWLLCIAKPLSPASGVPEARDASALGLGMLAAKAESVPIGYQIHSAS